MVNGPLGQLAGRPGTAAWTGLLFLLPFMVMNTIVARKVEPFMSVIRPTGHTSVQEVVLGGLVLLLMPAGALWALAPSLVKDRDGKLRFYLANLAVALGLMALFSTIAWALGSEIYACEYLQVPNCD